jgi:N-acyl-D-amino-acid deacylase
MRPWTTPLAVAAGLLAVMAAAALGQGYYVNPYTGRGSAAGQGYNPYTGQAPPSNPYTGQGEPAGYNPYTGYQPGAGAPDNPFTGRYTNRHQDRAAPGSWQRQPPVTGKAGSGLEHLDDAMLRILEKFALPGGALAIAKDGRLVLAKGYGWANLQTGEPVRPDAPFALASLSKALTAATILKLVDEGKLRLDDKAFAILGDLRLPPGVWVEPRLSKITIRNLLNHSGGWDRAKSGEPSSFSYRVSRALRVPLPIKPDDLIRFMATVPLDFDPGTQNQYSNFGYILLGRIIECVTGQPYAEAVRATVLEPAGVRRARLKGLTQEYEPGEVRRYQQGTDLLLPSRVLPPVADAAGSWVGSAVDMTRFLSALDGSRGKPLLSDAMLKEMLAEPIDPLKPREGGTWFGLGWDLVRKTPKGKGYWKDGLLPGTRTFMGRHPSGFCWVMLFNSGEGLTVKEVAAELDPRRDIEASVHGTKVWPDVDYFKDYP